MLLEISGSKRRRANSCRDDSHSGMRLAMCGFTTSVRYVRSVLATCSSAQADNTDILTIVCALVLSDLRSPIAVLPVSVASEISQRQSNGPIDEHIPVKPESADTRSFRILPIRSMSFTKPVAMKVAHTLIATVASSGDESAPKAGVKAEVIWAWYCSSSNASAKSGSGVLPNIYHQN